MNEEQLQEWLLKYHSEYGMQYPTFKKDGFGRTYMEFPYACYTKNCGRLYNRANYKYLTDIDHPELPPIHASGGLMIGDLFFDMTCITNEQLEAIGRLIRIAAENPSIDDSMEYEAECEIEKHWWDSILKYDVRETLGFDVSKFLDDHNIDIYKMFLEVITENEIERTFYDDGNVHYEDLYEEDIADAIMEKCLDVPFDTKKPGRYGVKMMIRRAGVSSINLADADLSNANLSGIDLVGASFRGADLSNANLGDANLTNAILSDARLDSTVFAGAIMTSAQLTNCKGHNAKFSGANLEGADFEWATLIETDFRDADLPIAQLFGANFTASSFRGANLSLTHARLANFEGCNFQNATLTAMSYDYSTRGIHPAPEGELIGWGKKSGHIVKMKIPADAKRSCATTRKYRAEYAIVLEIYGGLQTLEHKSRHSNYPRHPVVYEVGKEVRPDEWDEDRWQECSHGIHFFLTRKEAEEWDR